MYDDNPKLYVELLDCFCENLDRFFAEFGWCMFWYSERMNRFTRDTFRFKAPTFNVQLNPLIWVHSDNAGISPDHRHRPRHIYDSCLLLSRGDVPIVRVKSDAYASPTDHKLHPSTKPVPMLKHFFEMFVDEHTSVFDPTCGSGAALRAAEALGANRVLGIEADWERCEIARKALQDSRKLEDLWELSEPEPATA
jgi:DNA modification methylase